jgi:hypothetical protein
MDELVRNYEGFFCDPSSNLSKAGAIGVIAGGFSLDLDAARDEYSKLLKQQTHLQSKLSIKYCLYNILSTRWSMI